MNQRLLICDLDNTLYDWVGYFVPAFYEMVEEVVRITGCDRELLLDEFRVVHRRHHDSEHPFALLETPTVQEKYAGLNRQELAEKLNSAFHAFNSSRKKNLRLYPGVRKSLDTLSSNGYVLVAHTESKLYAAVDRLSRLGLTDYFRRVYCRERPRSEHPDPAKGQNWLSNFPMQKVTELSHHQRKPNPEVLTEICRVEGILPSATAYVGDSMTRDVVMAKASNVLAIWAKYGTSHAEKYEKLVRVTHWTEEDVRRERDLANTARSIQPDFVLEREFSEIIGVLSHVDPQFSSVVS